VQLKTQKLMSGLRLRSLKRTATLYVGTKWCIFFPVYIWALILR